MAENSNIEWTDHTFNPWTGCTKVSLGCAHCYAESWAKRSGTVQWGKGQPRRRTKTWGDPVKWNRAAKLTLRCPGCSRLCIVGDDLGKAAFGKCMDCDIWADDMPKVRPRVFSASLADWMDDEVPIEWLQDFLHLIDSCPNLDWLLLTKRPQNIYPRMMAAMNGNFDRLRTFKDHMPNVWLGTTCENQEMADERIPHLLKIEAKVRFLSCEPILGPIDLAYTAFNGADSFGQMPGIHWVIAGGESGPGARPMHPDWPRTLRDQCTAARVPFLFKQWGEWLPGSQNNTDHLGGAVHDWPDEFATKVGKHAAGRHLDGQLHTEFPTP